jgi:restriction system protein
MRPLLDLASDMQVHSSAEAREFLARRFGLTDQDLQELLPSGRQAVFANRVGWATTYLRQAGLIESAGRGHFKLTKRGFGLLTSLPVEITTHFLDRYPEFRAFRTAHRSKETESTKEPSDVPAATPEEQIDTAYQSWRSGLSAELLQRMRACPPAFFEQLVLDLLLAMGYGGSRREAASAVGRSGDGGIDGIINEDKLGLDVVYVQAKRWEGQVSSPVVNAFVGALVGRNASKGVLITTSSFSQPAITFAQAVAMKVVLIDGARLADLMIEHGIGVTDTATYTLKRIDEDYFEG